MALELQLEEVLTEHLVSTRGDLRTQISSFREELVADDLKGVVHNIMEFMESLSFGEKALSLEDNLSSEAVGGEEVGQGAGGVDAGLDFSRNKPHNVEWNVAQP